MPTPTTVQARFQVRADTAANWTSANPTLLLNELGFETDTKKLKMGDGTTAWSSLAYFPSIVSGGIVLGNLEIGTTGTLTFEGSTADGFETTLAVVDPTADRTITLPNVTGTVITTGDTGTVTSTMIADGTIVNADVNASAAIDSTKISFGSNTISTTGIFSAAAGTAAAPSITFTGDVDTGIYHPSANNFAITTAGIERVNFTDTVAAFNDAGNNYDFRIEGDTNGNLFFVDASADAIGIGKSDPTVLLDIESVATSEILRLKSSNASGVQQTFIHGTFGYIGGIGSPKYWDGTLSATDFGITSNANLDFSTNQLFRARITTAGNFGINDSAPDARLTVNGVASFGAGTVGAPGIAARGDLDTGIWFPAANTAAVSTAGVERLRILSTGGIQFPGATSGTITVSPTAVAGTTTITLPATTGTVVTTGDSGTITSTMIADGTILNADVNASAAIAGTKISPDFGSQSTTTTGTSTAASFIPEATIVTPTNGLYQAATNSIGLSTNSLERLRIDSSGRLLIGVSTTLQVPLSSATLGSPNYQLAGATQQGATSAQYAFNTTASVAPNLILARSRGATVGTQGLVSDGDSLGRVVFEGSDGQAIGTDAGFIRAAVIEGRVDGTASAGDMPGRLVLSTTADGASSPTEQLRITSDGVCAYNQAAPVAIDTSATATIANLKTGLITSSTAAAVTITLPTGTNCDGGFSGVYTNLTFEWSVINTGATNAVTVAGNTGHTIVGSATVAASNSGRFASRRTAANTWVSYRLSS